MTKVGERQCGRKSPHGVRAEASSGGWVGDDSSTGSFNVGWRRELACGDVRDRTCDTGSAMGLNGSR